MKSKKAYDLERLKDGLSFRAHTFCEYIFPKGRFRAGNYMVGNLDGIPGNSLRICVYGPKAGVWKDFATGEGGNNLLDLLYKVRGGEFSSACEEAANWLNCPENFRYDSEDVRQSSITETETKRSIRTPYLFKDLREGKTPDFLKLSVNLGIGIGGLLLAEKDGVLKFFSHPVNGRCWSVVDKRNLVRQDRRLDGRPFVLADGSMAKMRTIGFPGCPIGIPTDKPAIALVEGSSDFLAAYSLVHTGGVEASIAPVAMLGAANNIHSSSLQHFQDRHILAFPDYDSAGINGMSHWQKQLEGIAATFEIFDYASLIRDDGQPIKDLRDFLRIDVDQWESDKNIKSPLASFSINYKEKDII